MNQTDQEQIESLKLFWARWGKTIIIALIILFAAIIGQNVIQNQLRAAKEAPSDIYQPLLLLVAKGDNLTGDDKKQINDISNTLKAEHASSAYAHFAALEVAKLAVIDKDYALAISEFDFVLDNNQQPLLADIVLLRKARVMSANGDTQKALELIKDVTSNSQAGQFAELAGDFSYYLGNNDAALDYYQQAASVYQGSMFDHRLLQQKLDDLAKAE